MKLASFDIFDTVLLRDCGSPEQIFYETAVSVFPTDEAKQKEFIFWRKKAESLASERIKTEVTYSDIYSTYNLCQSDIDSNFAFDSELQVESQNLHANKEFINVIEEKRKEGYTIAFISDMYLSSSFLTGILKREKLFYDGDYIFVSNEYNARKSNGALYEIVRDKLSPSSWVHYGDNIVSDKIEAKKHNVVPEHKEFGYTGVEKEFLESCRCFPGNNGTASLVGYLRKLRLDSLNNPFSNLAIDYVSAIYVPYVKYVLQDACSRGLQRLYFLSRDSIILYEIAEILPHPGIELRTLFLSRKSLQPASYLMTSEERKYFSSVVYSEFSNDNSASLKDEYLLLDEYLEQEGLYDNCRSGMVDVGWVGTTRGIINTILKHHNKENVFFYYWGIRNDCLSSTHGGFNVFLENIQIKNISTEFIENYCSACPYPSTIGYEKNNDKVIPCFDPSANYDEGKRYLANVDACKKIARYISNRKDLPMNMLSYWSIFTFKYYFSHKDPTVDYTPLFSKSLNEAELSKRFSCKDVFNYIVRQHRISIFDEESVIQQFGFKRSKTIKKIRGFFSIIMLFKKRLFRESI